MLFANKNNKRVKLLSTALRNTLHLGGEWLSQSNPVDAAAALTNYLKKYLNFNRKKTLIRIVAIQKGLNSFKTCFWIPILAVLAILFPAIGNQTKNLNEILYASIVH